MRFSSRFIPSPAVAISSLALLLCGLSGTAMSQTATASNSSLPSITVDAPKPVARPYKPIQRAVAHNTVRRTVRHTVSPATSPTTPFTAAQESVLAKLQRLERSSGSCVGGCATSFKYGDAPWHGCSVSGGTISSTCRNTANYKTYSECTETGLLIGWRVGDVSWYCTSLALK
jgi:hypothetical protein